MFFKIVEESRLKKYSYYKTLIVIVAFILIGFTLLIVFVTPFASYFNFKITHMQTDYWTKRYFLMFVYILFNVLINVFPLVNNFLFFLSDGVILS